MNQPAKFVLAIGVAALAMVAIMFATKQEPVKKKIDGTKPKKKPPLAPENIKSLQKLSSEEQEAEIKNIRLAIKRTNIDAFDNVSDKTFSDKFSDSELHKLYLAINEKTKYSTESEFRAKAPQYFDFIMWAISKINGGKSVKS